MAIHPVEKEEPWSVVAGFVGRGCRCALEFAGVYRATRVLAAPACPCAVAGTLCARRARRSLALTVKHSAPKVTSDSSRHRQARTIANRRRARAFPNKPGARCMGRHDASNILTPKLRVRPSHESEIPRSRRPNKRRAARSKIGAATWAWMLRFRLVVRQREGLRWLPSPRH